MPVQAKTLIVMNWLENEKHVKEIVIWYVVELYFSFLYLSLHELYHFQSIQSMSINFWLIICGITTQINKYCILADFSLPGIAQLALRPQKWKIKRTFRHIWNISQKVTCWDLFKGKEMSEEKNCVHLQGKSSSKIYKV